MNLKYMFVLYGFLQSSITSPYFFNTKIIRILCIPKQTASLFILVTSGRKEGKELIAALTFISRLD